jgi:hypothetical protein
MRTFVAAASPEHGGTNWDDPDRDHQRTRSGACRCGAHTDAVAVSHWS